MPTWTEDYRDWPFYESGTVPRPRRECYGSDGNMLTIASDEQLAQSVAQAQQEDGEVGQQYTDDLVNCMECNGDFPSDEATRGPDFLFRCQGCHEETHVNCLCCYGIVSRCDAHQYAGGSYCDTCYYERFSACGSCGFEYPIVDMSEGFCDDCNDFSEDDDDRDRTDRRRGEECVPDVHEAGVLTNRCFAVELECYDASCEAVSLLKQDNWSVVKDSSLTSLGGGLEFVSGPRGGKQGALDIEKACKVLSQEGANVDATCGMHLHIDATQEDADTVARFVRLGARLEEWAFSVVPQSRRDNETFCRRLPRKAYSCRCEYTLIKAVYVDGEEPDHTNKYDYSRYVWINAHSWFYRGTVEIRLHAGTVNARKILNWTEFWLHAFEYAKTATTQQIDNLPRDSTAGYVLAERINLPDDLMDYFRSRSGKFEREHDAGEVHDEKDPEPVSSIAQAEYSDNPF